MTSDRYVTLDDEGYIEFDLDLLDSVTLDLWSIRKAYKATNGKRIPACIEMTLLFLGHLMRLISGRSTTAMRKEEGGED